MTTVGPQKTAAFVTRLWSQQKLYDALNPNEFVACLRTCCSSDVIQDLINFLLGNTERDKRDRHRFQFISPDTGLFELQVDFVKFVGWLSPLTEMIDSFQF
jgi:hypothetical protein